MYECDWMVCKGVDVYEKVTDEQESGELLKQKVKNKLTVSMGYEKQVEHVNKKLSKASNE